MKEFKNVVVLLLLCIAMLLTVSCEVSNGKFFNGAVNVNVLKTAKAADMTPKAKSISLGSSNSIDFTAMPELNNVFKKYTASLIQGNQTLVVDSDSKTFVFPEVEVGEYTLVVNGYKSTDTVDSNKIASVTKNLEVITNTEIPADVVLIWLEDGQGSFDFEVKIPNTSSITSVEIAGLTSTEIITATDNGTDKVFAELFSNIAQGEYDLTITYKAGDTVVETKTAVLHSYSNLTSILKYSEQTDLSNIEAEIEIIDLNDNTIVDRDGSSGNEYLNTDQNYI